MVDQGFGAHGEFAHGEHAGDVSGFIPVAVSDDLLPNLAESASLFGTMSAADVLSCLVSGSIDLRSMLARTDQLAVSLVASALIAAVQDTLTDDLALAPFEATGVATVVSRVEDLLIDLADVFVTPMQVGMVRSDRLALRLSRYLGGPGFGAQGEFAHGEHYNDRHDAMAVREIAAIFSTLSTLDTLTPGLSEARDVLAALERLDSLLVAVAGDALAEERLHRRIINIIQY